VKTVAARQLKAMLHDGGELALLDVREAGQFGESHLLFATPLPYSRLELDIGALVPRKSARIAVCDDDGKGTAALAAKRLAALGYSDVAVLEGGNRAWAAAGHALFKGVNVPSKLFGELVEHEYHTPRITAQELVRMKETSEDFILLDGRPLNEHHKMTIPGSTCCPNGELPYRVSSMVKNPRTKIVVNCAGRTRSILGAQTLINFGIPNPAPRAGIYPTWSSSTAPPASTPTGSARPPCLRSRHPPAASCSASTFAPPRPGRSRVGSPSPAVRLICVTCEHPRNSRRGRFQARRTRQAAN
jgi:rhodanese-related sulfurtransferase